MKVLLLSNQSRSMAIFWRVLIAAMQARGMAVSCCVPPGDAESDAMLAKLGANVIHYPLDRKGLNPLRDLWTLKSLLSILSAVRPGLIFATTIKPVIYGALAAHRAGIGRFFATITGLGYAFEVDSLFKKIINRISRLLYRRALKHAAGVFFQNKDDAALFRAQGILTKDIPVFFARGTGVDTTYFAQAPLPPQNPLVFLLICRLLEAKGIADYVAAARIVKKNWPETRFQLLGPPESGPGSISGEQLRNWQDTIEYLGQATDVRPFIAASHVVVLPSWREGLPTVLMEAMSMGRAIVATNVPGCRDVVVNGVNGFLADVRNPVSLAAAMAEFLQNPALIASMGKAGRNLAVEKFDAEIVARNILKDMIGSQA